MPQGRRDFYIREPYVRRAIPEAEVNVTDRWESIQVKYRNSLVSQPLVFGGAYSGGGGGSGSFGSGNCGDWMAAVKDMAQYFVSVKAHYFNGLTVGPCPLIGNSKIQPDCSGFVSACFSYFIKSSTYRHWTTATMVPPSSKGYTDLTSNGWSHQRLSDADAKKMATSERWNILKEGDIVRHCADGYPPGTGHNNLNGHTYIIGANNTRYEMGGKNGRHNDCKMPYNDYTEGGAASGKYWGYDIFRR